MNTIWAIFKTIFFIAVFTISLGITILVEIYMVSHINDMLVNDYGMDERFVPVIWVVATIIVVRMMIVSFINVFWRWVISGLRSSFSLS